MPIGDCIANRRYVVRGEREDDGRRAPLYATDDPEEAARVLGEGRTVDGRRWRGVGVHDRRVALLPAGGWYA